MNDNRINQIWRAGYCIDLVRWSMRPEADSEEARLAYLREHSMDCRECYFANILKGLEKETSEAMGPEAKMAWLLGQDVSQMPHFQPSFRRIMDKAMKDGTISPIMTAWMRRVAMRRDFEWRR
jgi:hypothetical protein